MSQAWAAASRLTDGADRRDRLRAARLYLVTDDGTPAGSLPGLIAQAVRGGVGLVQLRRKWVQPEQLAELGRECREAAHAEGAIFLVDDHVELALAVGADGVHLGQSDLGVAEARALLGPELLIGVSTHDRAQVTAASAAELDYISAGPVHETPTKAGRPAVGFEHVEVAARNTTVPVVAIGGLDASNAARAIEAGADMVGVVRAICASPDPGATAAALRAEIDAARSWGWIEINGRPRKCRPGESLAGLVAAFEIEPAGVVVERNGTIVDPARWVETAVGDGDRLEIVHFVGGG
jgi:thiamine-phosphate pyrophosphorylase